MQAKAGLKSESSPSSQPRTPIGDNRALTDSINENTLPRTHSIDPQLEVSSLQNCVIITRLPIKNGYKAKIIKLEMFIVFKYTTLI